VWTSNGQKADLSAIPPASLTIPLNYSGTATPQLWGIDLCARSKFLPPNGSQPCPHGAYISNYQLSSGSWFCAEQFDTIIQMPVWNTKLNGAWISFGSSSAVYSNWTANVYVVCGPTVALSSVTQVSAVGPSSQLTLEIIVASSIICL
jgi:hypothetical protein